MQPRFPPQSGDFGSGRSELTAVMPTGFVSRGGDHEVAELVAEGGIDFRYSNSGPEVDLAAVLSSPESDQDCAAGRRLPARQRFESAARRLLIHLRR